MSAHYQQHENHQHTLAQSLQTQHLNILPSKYLNFSAIALLVDG